MTTVCAGCGKILKGPPPKPGERVSHGMCSRECWDRAAEEKERSKNPPAHWLEDTKSALKWALKNLPDARQDYPKGNSDLARSLRYDKEESIEEYVSNYYTVMAKGKADVFRMLAVSSDWSEVDWVYWSFSREGAGVYSGAQKGSDTYVLLKATANFDQIDWEHGFTSFWYYGMEQFECALISGSEIVVDKIYESKRERGPFTPLDVPPFKAVV